jgi:UDP-N-acetylmuramoyl-L-alanyl-D-glutamate--2,6-diaminopimelate ligase
MLNEMQDKCGLIGTIQYDLGGRCLPAARTTPDSLETFAMLHQMRRAGCKNAAMEISSHAISQNRVLGLDVDCACFLNLTQDHIDYHMDMESYFETKASLFTGALGTLPRTAAINIDDEKGREIAGRISHKTKLATFSVENSDAKIYAKNLKLGRQASEFTLVWPEGEAQVELKVPGRYNVSNALAAFACLYSTGKDLNEAAKSLRTFKGVPGRMQKVQSAAPFDIFVDYAHTDDALKNALEMLREIVKGRILVVFGCGGRRDRTKRPKMTAVVQKYADIAWATSDNPRGEDVNQIFSDMKGGVSDPSKIAFVENRRRAINLAIDAADKGDCILIAGKGHEAFQELGDTIIPFDDKRVAEELLEVKGF